jgi:exodeoxyribonuclease V alpha subunit
VPDLRATRPLRATGRLGEFAAVGILESADVHVAQRLGRIADEHDEVVLLAVALTVRAVRHGSVCLDLTTAESSIAVEDADEDDLARLAALVWPTPDQWTVALTASPLVAVGREGHGSRPLRLVGHLLYLDRYWRQEQVIAAAVDARRARAPHQVDREQLRATLARLFPADAADRQRLAAAVAAQRWITVLAGGPGTGKTTTVAKLLAVLHDQADHRLRVALAAPTGKAAARLEEAVRGEVAQLAEADRMRVGEVSASTLHRLLGWTPNRTRFMHHRDNRRRWSR